ncbi:hypothetical protein BKA57DRAFT_468261 [Linnemannia elongata]|nr:hypothetical protein BKA57DRAFT_468261 [Linnemannia elongata]
MSRAGIQIIAGMLALSRLSLSLFFLSLLSTVSIFLNPFFYFAHLHLNHRPALVGTINGSLTRSLTRSLIRLSCISFAPYILTSHFAAGTNLDRVFCLGSLFCRVWSLSRLSFFSLSPLVCTHT